MKVELIRAVLRDTHALVIDPEGEYAHVVSALVGQVVEIRPGTCRGLNPFAFTDNSAGALDARIAALSTFLSLLAAPIIRIRGGRIVSVRPRATTAPLLAVASSIWRSRPGSNPPVFGSDIAVEGLNEVLALAEGASA